MGGFVSWSNGTDSGLVGTGDVRIRHAMKPWVVLQMEGSSALWRHAGTYGASGGLSLQLGGRQTAPFADRFTGVAAGLLTIQPLQTDVNSYAPTAMLAYVYRVHSRYTVTETDVRLLIADGFGGVEVESAFGFHMQDGWHLMVAARYRLLLVDSSYTGARIGIHWRARRDTPGMAP